MKKIVVFIVCVSLFSCVERNKIDVKSFRTGTFEIPGDEKLDRTIFTRNDTLQIEKYGNRVDSLAIHWKNNFNYTLRMLNPKTDLDKELINVKITKVTPKAYNFEAIIGHSNYIQKGTVNKISE